LEAAIMKQHELPFVERDDLLRHVEFSQQAGCLPATLKAVLSEISRFPECWESQVKIASVAKCSRATVQRAIKVLTQLDLITTERRWCHAAQQVRNFHRVNWEELRRLRERETAKPMRDYGADQSISQGRPKHQSEADQSISQGRPKHQSEADQSISLSGPKHQPEADQSISLSGPKHQSEADQSISLRHHNYEVKLKDKTTTTKMVEVVFSLGVNKAAHAVAESERQGLTEADMLERVNAYRSRPADGRQPGVLYNWLANPLSFTKPITTVSNQRGDALTKEQTNDVILRTRIVRGCRQRGESEPEIKVACELAGVRYE
jgi:hypothetical protein